MTTDVQDVPEDGTQALQHDEHTESTPAAEDAANAEASALSILFNPTWVKLYNPVGEGAFSRVFEGIYTKPTTNEHIAVAVKILKKSKQQRRSDCMRFIKEAKIMTKISHRNIAACHGIGKYDESMPHYGGCLFIVQELLKGGNLLHKVYKQMLSRHKCLYSSAQALQWMIEVADGMRYLHLQSGSKAMIIHRDLKLENIMLHSDEDGITVKLVDFGLHKVIDHRVRKVVKRVLSEAHLGGGGGLRGGVARCASRLGGLNRLPEEGIREGEEDELEAALREQREQGARLRGEQAGQDAPPSYSIPEDAPNYSPLGYAMLEPSAPSTPDTNSPLSLSRGLSPQTSRSQSLARPEDGSTSPAAAPVRRPPTKTTSMQKLVAKMKELKVKFTGTKKDGREADMDSLGSAASSPGATQDGLSCSREPATLPAAAPAQPLSKAAANEALLNQILAQQQGGPAAQRMMDEHGLMDGRGGPARRAPIRRAVTWVNEIRYNLTQAVGSWAYMAPEVVLGQPYNEKVDVFSFAVIIYEVLSRKLMLIDEIKTDPRKDAQMYAERVAAGFRQDIPKFWPEPLRQLIHDCWAQDPHMRPNFEAIFDVLKELNDSNSIGVLDTAYFSNGAPA